MSTISGVGGMSEFDFYRLSGPPEPSPRIQRAWEAADANASRLSDAMEAAFASAALTAGIKVEAITGPLACATDGDFGMPALAWRCPQGECAADTNAAQLAEFVTAVVAALRAMA